jgi:DNA-directed RNA polymerase subunit beta
MANPARKVFGTEGHPYPLTNLINVQTDSFKWLIDHGIREILDEVSPIEDFTGKTFSLSLLEHSIGDPKYSPEMAIEKGASYSAPI